MPFKQIDSADQKYLAATDILIGGIIISCNTSRYFYSELQKCVFDSNQILAEKSVKMALEGK